MPANLEKMIMANNRVVHFEIPANQPEALTKFYSALFGWKFEKAALPGRNIGSATPARTDRALTAP